MSSNNPAAPVSWWLAESVEDGVKRAIERMSRLEDVVRIAVLPDVHVAGDTCVGTATATRRLIYPALVGGDIGCGMLALGFDADASVLRNGDIAGRILRRLCETIPAMRRNRRFVGELPDHLPEAGLSCESLRSFAKTDAALQLGTVGGGNHFVELQSDEHDRLWLMIHTGSRAIGQAVRNHHVSFARGSPLAALDAQTPAGQAYLSDAAWAGQYAATNRACIANDVTRAVREVLGADPIESTHIECDHNHVRPEHHHGELV